METNEGKEEGLTLKDALEELMAERLLRREAESRADHLEARLEELEGPKDKGARRSLEERLARVEAAAIIEHDPFGDGERIEEVTLHEALERLYRLESEVRNVVPRLTREYEAVAPSVKRALETASRADKWSGACGATEPVAGVECGLARGHSGSHLGTSARPECAIHTWPSEGGRPRA